MDLITNIVCEFPELQGTIGMYYSLEDNEKKEFLLRLKNSIYHLFSGDKLPKLLWLFIIIVDKMDTFIRMFYVGNIPSADKDPFALRRLAIGIIRIIITKIY